MKLNFEKTLVAIIVIISMVIIYKIPRLLINKNNKPLPEVKLREIKDNKSFAIMIQNENGYEEYNKDTWPTDGYKFKEAKCTDNNGSLVDKAITYNNGKVTLTTNQTIYCTLYFDKKLGVSALDIVASKPKSLSPNPDQGDMYRYQGTSELVNDNYICFGTKEKSECTNDKDHYMYRIIGITPEGEMKLIKQTPVVEEGNTVFSWYKATGTDENGPLYGTAEKGFETWPESAIYKRLNGLSNGTITGDGQNASQSTNKNINADTNIFVDSYTDEYPYMNRQSDWYKKIADHDWTYGDTTEETYDGHKMYQIETGKIETKCTTYDQSNGHNTNATCQWNKETDKVTAKIGLPYLHDILLTYYDGLTDDSRGNSSQTNLTNFWIVSISNGYNGISTMVKCYNFNEGEYPTGFSGIRSMSRSSILKCNIASANAYYRGLFVYPTFYLINTIEMEGTGTEADPYRIAN